jgi:hypothetical protein
MRWTRVVAYEAVRLPTNGDKLLKIGFTSEIHEILSNTFLEFTG